MSSFELIFFLRFIFLFCLMLFGCGIDDISILPSPQKVDNRISRDSFAFVLPEGYFFSNRKIDKLRGFDIYYKFYPEGENYYIGSSFKKMVQKDFDDLKAVFNDDSKFNNKGFYRINLNLTSYSGKPTLKLDKKWIDNKLPLYFEINFEELSKYVPGEAFLNIRNGINSLSPLIIEKSIIYRSYMEEGRYVGFSESLKKSKLLDKDKRPIDLKHIDNDFFMLDVSPRYNLVFFVMGVGDIMDDVYSMLVDLGDLSGFELI